MLLKSSNSLINRSNQYSKLLTSAANWTRHKINKNRDDNLSSLGEESARCAEIVDLIVDSYHLYLMSPDQFGGDDMIEVVDTVAVQ